MKCDHQLFLYLRVDLNKLSTLTIAVQLYIVYVSDLHARHISDNADYRVIQYYVSYYFWIIYVLVLIYS